MSLGAHTLGEKAVADQVRGTASKIPPRRVIIAEPDATLTPELR
jgi:hypothetical protein